MLRSRCLPQVGALSSSTLVCEGGAAAGRHSSPPQLKRLVGLLKPQGEAPCAAGSESGLAVSSRARGRAHDLLFYVSCFIVLSASSMARGGQGI